MKNYVGELLEWQIIGGKGQEVAVNMHVGSGEPVVSTAVLREPFSG